MSVDAGSRLASVPLFAGLDANACSLIGACSAEVEVPEGQLLMERDQPASGMFVILDGTVRVELPGRTLELGPGEVVGELSLLTEAQGRTARVAAATDVRCIAIPRAEFMRLLEEEPRIAVPLVRVLAERLRGMIEHHH